MPRGPFRAPRQQKEWDSFLSIELNITAAGTFLGSARLACCQVPRTSALPRNAHSERTELKQHQLITILSDHPNGQSEHEYAPGSPSEEEFHCRPHTPRP